jgi:anti-sigma B factor antagonist
MKRQEALGLRAMASTPLTATSEPFEGGVRVRFSGELDIATAPRAEEEIRASEEQQPDTLAVDLSGLSFMDSTGLRLIVAAAARARDVGRRLIVVRGPDPVHRVLELTGLDSRLEIVESV